MLSLVHKKRVLIPLIAAITLIVTFAVERLLFSPKYDFQAPRVGPIVEAVYSLGTVKSDQVYMQKLGVLARIDKLYVKEGDQVRQGDPLLRTDSGVVFTAPFSGVVTRIYFNEREIVTMGAVILTVMNLNKLYIQVALDQESALLIRTGQHAELSFESIRGKKIKGKVDKIYPSAGQFLVRIEVEKMPEEILPEMTADVAIEVARREKALLIPISAIQRGMVRLKRKGKTVSVRTEIGAIDGVWAEVLDDSIQKSDEIMIPIKQNNQEQK